MNRDNYKMSSLNCIHMFPRRYFTIHSTAGENINATTKKRNNYVAIQSLIFPLDSSLMLLKKLSLLILFASVFVSVLSFFFYGSLSKVIALPTIAIEVVVALKGDSEKITVTFR